MKIALALCLVAFAVSVNSESCTSLANCKETKCNLNHGWRLHCTSGLCLCSHDIYTGKPCTDGSAATCQAVHGDRCQNLGTEFRYHCVDSVCHCVRHS